MPTSTHADANTFHRVRYQILDPKRNYPTTQLLVNATRGEIRDLVEQGYLIREDLFTPSQLNEMREALSSVAETEQGYGDQGCFGGQYIRYLMDKKSIFLDIHKLKPTLSIAKAVLGPQVQFDQVDARVVPANSKGAAVPWHTHFRVIPKPVPPFFCYPHAIHCLLYLDDVDERTGQLCIIPGSHKDLTTTFPPDDFSDKPGQLVFSFRAGTCFIMHCNLWHRTLPGQEGSGSRRLIIFGYMPSWLRGDERGGVRPANSLRDEFLRNADQESRNLLGEFYWG